MREPLTSTLMLEQMEKLVVAFPRARGSAPLDRMADLYRDNLRGVSGEALRWAVTAAIREDQYFPKIARLHQLAQRFQIQNPDRSTNADPLYCRGCQQRSRLEARWRPKINVKGRQMTDDIGRLALEAFTRYQCDCSAPSQWMVDAADDPFMSPRTPAPTPSTESPE
jgi:hypothetical protein